MLLLCNYFHIDFKNLYNSSLVDSNIFKSCDLLGKKKATVHSLKHKNHEKITLHQIQTHEDVIFFILKDYFIFTREIL